MSTEKLLLPEKEAAISISKTLHTSSQKLSVPEKIGYSLGDLADNPYGPFRYSGRILNPVIGWTSHHSIVEFNNGWYLFYHDSSLSKGVTHLRSVKVAKIEYDENGFIKTINPYKDLNL